MANRTSAGILLYRRNGDTIEVLLGHMGGPFWARKHAGAWTIPKGEHTADEDPLTVACREFEEELGHPVPTSTFVDLGTVRQRGGKEVRAWAAQGDLDPATCSSNTFTMEWPPRSGTMVELPEIDRVAWVDLDTAKAMVVSGQAPLLDRLLAVA